MNLSKFAMLVTSVLTCSSIVVGIVSNATAVDESCPTNMTLRAVKLAGGTAYKTPCRTNVCRFVGQETIRYGTPVNPFDPFPVKYRYRAVAGETPALFCSGDVNGGTWR